MEYQYSEPMYEFTFLGYLLKVKITVTIIRKWLSHKGQGHKHLFVSHHPMFKLKTKSRDVSLPFHSLAKICCIVIL